MGKIEKSKNRKNYPRNLKLSIMIQGTKKNKKIQNLAKKCHSTQAVYGNCDKISDFSSRSDENSCNIPSVKTTTKFIISFKAKVTCEKKQKYLKKNYYFF